MAISKPTTLAVGGYMLGWAGVSGQAYDFPSTPGDTSTSDIGNIISPLPKGSRSSIITYSVFSGAVTPSQLNVIANVNVDDAMNLGASVEFNYSTDGGATWALLAAFTNLTSNGVVRLAVDVTGATLGNIQLKCTLYAITDDITATTTSATAGIYDIWVTDAITNISPSLSADSLNNFSDTVAVNTIPIIVPVDSNSDNWHDAVGLSNIGGTVGFADSMAYAKDSLVFGIGYPPVVSKGGMQILINNGLGFVDYTQYVLQESIQIVDSINVPTVVKMTLSNNNAAFVVPKRNSYVRIISNNPYYATQKVLATGFVTNEPVRVFKGMSQSPGVAFGYQIYEYAITVSSDEWLANSKSVPFIPAFVNQTQGQILSRLLQVLVPGFYNVSSFVASGDIVPYLDYDPEKTWADYAKEFGDASRYRYKVIDRVLYYLPFGDAPLGLAYDDAGPQATFDPKGLVSDVLSVRPVNDAIVIGDVEPATYCEDNFVGDGFTGNFQLKHTMFEGFTSLLLQENWDAATFSTDLWNVQDITNNFFLSGALNVQGGPGDLDQSYILGLNGVELGGALNLQHGEFLFTKASKGLVGGVYSSPDLLAANCIAGFDVSTPGFSAPSASGATGIAITPMFNGVVQGPSVLTQLNHHYLLQTVINGRRWDRYTRVYRTLAGSPFGGTEEDALGEVTFIIGDVDLTKESAPITTTYYSVKDVTLPAFGLYAPINNNDLWLVLQTTMLAFPPQATLEVRSLYGPSGGSLPTLPANLGPYQHYLLGFGFNNPIGTVGQSGDVNVLQFYNDTIYWSNGDITVGTTTIPSVGARIRFRSWEAAQSVGRVRDTANIAQEGVIIGDDGVRLSILTNLSPAPRTSQECEQAAAAAITDRELVQFQGTYTVSSWFWDKTQDYPRSGRYFYVNSPQRGMNYRQMVVSTVTTTVKDLRGEWLEFVIDYSPDNYLEKLLPKFLQRSEQLLSPKDAGKKVNYITLDQLAAAWLEDLKDCMLTDMDGSSFTVDMGLTPALGYAIEIRRADVGWGVSAQNLITTTTQRIITLPRTSYDQTIYLRLINGTLTSRYSKKIRISAPMVPQAPVALGVDLSDQLYPVFEVSIAGNDDIRNIYGLELRSQDDQSVIAQQAFGSFQDLNYTYNNTAFKHRHLTLNARFFNLFWNMSAPTPITYDVAMPSISGVALQEVGGAAPAPSTSAGPIAVTVPSKAMPWNTLINSSFSYGVNDGEPPVVLPYTVTPGSTVQITYVSGQVKMSDARPYVGPTGQASYITDSITGSTGTYFPTKYIPGSTLGLGGLVCVFTDITGKIVGIPFEASATSVSKVVPAGAVQLQFGIDDDRFVDNLGDFNISVTITNIPPPTPTTAKLITWYVLAGIPTGYRILITDSNDFVTNRYTINHPHNAQPITQFQITDQDYNNLRNVFITPFDALGDGPTESLYHAGTAAAADCFDPRAYGAVADGVTDDTLAVQGALDAASAAAIASGQPRTVCIPENTIFAVKAHGVDAIDAANPNATYNYGPFAVALYIDANVTLKVDGTLTLLDLTNAEWAALQWPRNYVMLENRNAWNGGPSQKGGTGWYADAFPVVEGPHVDTNVTVTGLGAIDLTSVALGNLWGSVSAVLFIKADDSLVESVHIKQSQSAAVMIWFCRNTVVRNLVVTVSDGGMAAGISLSSAHSCQVRNCTLTPVCDAVGCASPNAGIILGASDYCLVDGNVITGPFYYGVSVTDQDEEYYITPQFFPSNSQVSNNIITGVRAAGVLASGSIGSMWYATPMIGTKITNNIINGNVYTNPTSQLVSDRYTTYGIAISGIQEGLVSGNDCSNCGYWGYAEIQDNFTPSLPPSYPDGYYCCYKPVKSFVFANNTGRNNGGGPGSTASDSGGGINEASMNWWVPNIPTGLSPACGSSSAPWGVESITLNNPQLSSTQLFSGSSGNLPDTDFEILWDAYIVGTGSGYGGALGLNLTDQFTLTDAAQVFWNGSTEKTINAVDSLVMLDVVSNVRASSSFLVTDTMRGWLLDAVLFTKAVLTGTGAIQMRLGDRFFEWQENIVTGATGTAKLITDRIGLAFAVLWGDQVNIALGGTYVTKPTTATTSEIQGSLWANLANAYDLPLTPGDTSTYAEFNYTKTSGVQENAAVQFKNFAGLILPSKLNMNIAYNVTDAGSAGNYVFASYSLDGGVTWRNFDNIGFVTATSPQNGAGVVTVTADLSVLIANGTFTSLSNLVVQVWSQVYYNGSSSIVDVKAYDVWGTN